MSSYLEKKTIINEVLINLEGIVKSFRINLDNFSTLVIKVMENLKTYTQLTPSNRYQLSIEILMKIINDMELESEQKVYLLGTIPSMVFDFADINSRKLDLSTPVMAPSPLSSKQSKLTKNTKNTENTEILQPPPTPPPTPSSIQTNDIKDVIPEENNNMNESVNNIELISVKALPKTDNEQTKKTENNVNNLESIVNELYNSIYNMITQEEINPVEIPAQLITIVTKTVQVINKYSDLKGSEKKQLVLSAFDKLNNNIDVIFPTISEQDKKMIKLALSTIPSLIDNIISVINMKYDIDFENIIKKTSALSKLFCCLIQK
jgi:hypothetical protein